MTTISDLRTTRTGFNDVADLLEELSGEFTLSAIYSVPATSVPITLNTSTLTTVTGMSQAITIADGDLVKISCQVNNSMSSTSANSQFRLYRDSTAIGVLAYNESSKADASAQGFYDIIPLVAADIPSAGSYTYTLKGRLGGGSGGSAYVGGAVMIIEHFTKGIE